MESPEHYARCAIQPIDLIVANGLGFCEGNVVKYVCRYPHKGNLSDLLKARHYLDLLIEHQQQQTQQEERPPFSLKKDDNI